MIKSVHTKIVNNPIVKLEEINISETKIEIKLLTQIIIENKIDVLSKTESRIIKKETMNSETENPQVSLTKASIKVEMQMNINNETSGNNSTSLSGKRM